MSGFDAAWLRLREPFDRAARNAELARRFGDAMRRERREPLRILDLAAGTGAGFRALAPLLGGDQAWLLVDHDPRLIAAQAAEITRWAVENGLRCEAFDGGVVVQAGSGRWVARACPCDLALDLEALEGVPCDGVTTTAFLDLVSAAWLDRLCRVLEQRRLPLLAALTVDGRRVWNPPLPADAPVDAAFARHQVTAKGFGPALGGAGASYLADRLATRGWAVRSARSDWRIASAHRDMLLRMIDESAAVAAEMDPARAAVLAEWAARRRAQAQSGRLSLEIGHVDVLATVI